MKNQKFKVAGIVFVIAGIVMILSALLLIFIFDHDAVRLIAGGLFLIGGGVSLANASKRNTRK